MQYLCNNDIDEGRLDSIYIGFNLARTRNRAAFRDESIAMRQVSVATCQRTLGLHFIWMYLGRFKRQKAVKVNEKDNWSPDFVLNRFKDAGRASCKYQMIIFYRLQYSCESTLEIKKLLLKPKCLNAEFKINE